MKGGGSLWLTGGQAALRAPPRSPWRGPLGEAVSFRAGSPGFRDILPRAEGGHRECENQLLRNPEYGGKAGARVGREHVGGPRCPPGPHR